MLPHIVMLMQSGSDLKVGTLPTLCLDPSTPSVQCGSQRKSGVCGKPQPIGSIIDRCFGRYRERCLLTFCVSRAGQLIVPTTNRLASYQDIRTNTSRHCMDGVTAPMESLFHHRREI